MKLGLLQIWFLVLFIILVFLSVAISFAYDKEEETYSEIPNIVHKIHITRAKDIGLSNSLRKAHQSWTKMNPNYEIKYWNKESCENYLKKNFPPKYLATFQCINAFAGKCNFFRYCIMFNEGGWYSDWKQVCLKKNILKKLSRNQTFVYFEDAGNRYSRKNKCIQNAFFGIKPKHPLLEEVIDNTIMNTRNRYYGKHPLDTTGVCLFGKTIRNSIHSTSSSGRYFQNYFRHHLYGIIVQHKVEFTGRGQNWKKGNNYGDLWRDRAYYCSDEIKF